MLAKIAPRLVISRVIQTAYYAENMAVELIKEPIGESALHFYFEDPKKYFECNFYGFISSQTPPTEFENQYEAEKYQEAVQKLAVYNQVRAVFEKLDEFTLELRELYRSIEAGNTSSNFFARSKDTDEILGEDIHDALARYHEFLDKLQAYPEWHTKVVEEVGKFFHLIHNNLEDGNIKRSLFSKLNRQQYFV